MRVATRLFACGLLAGLTAALALTGDAAAQTRKFTFGYDQPHSTAYGIAADLFNAKLMELSKGTMGIDQFPGAQLGQEPVMLQKIRTGDIDFIITSTANASSVAPQAGVFSLHYLFRDKNHLVKVLADPAVTKEFEAMIDDSVKGAHVIGLMTMGLRNMYSKSAIHAVGDIKGKKIRVQATKTEDTHFPAYGAQTVHMPFGEVYTSLQTGVVDVAENGVNVYMANKHYEVAPVLSMTEHEANNNCIWVSDKTWKSLSPEQQGWVMAAAAEVSNKEPLMGLKLESDSAAKLKKMGVQIVEGVDKSGFVKDAQPIQDQLAKELGPHAVKLLQLVRDVKYRTGMHERRRRPKRRRFQHKRLRSRHCLTATPFVVSRYRHLKWQALDPLESILMILCGVAIGGFTLSVFVDVVTRTLHLPILWLQLVTTGFFAWGVFIGMAVATRRLDHLNLVEITKQMTGTKRATIELIDRAVILAVALCMVIFGIQNFFNDLGSYRAPSLIPLATYTACVPLSGALIVLFTIEQMVNGWRHGFEGPEDADDFSGVEK